MRHRAYLLLVASAWFANALAETPADRWNLSDIYPSDVAWNADAAKLEAQMKDFAGCKGQLGDSAARFRQCLDLQADMTKRYFRLAAFSSEQLSEDTGSSAYLDLNQKLEILGAKFNEAGSFVDPELLHLGEARIAQFLASDPALKIYRHQLDETLRAAPHTLNDEGEALVAQFGLMNNTGNIGVHHPHRRRLALADDQAVDGRRGQARRRRLHQVRAAREPRRSQAGDGRVFRRLQDLRAHASASRCTRN